MSGVDRNQPSVVLDALWQGSATVAIFVGAIWLIDWITHPYWFWTIDHLPRSRTRRRFGRRKR